MPFSDEIALERGLDGRGKHVQIFDEQLIMLALLGLAKQFTEFPI